MGHKLTSALSVERHDPGREAGGVALAVEGQLSVADDLVEPVAAQQARELAELACRSANSNTRFKSAQVLVRN